MRLRVGDDNDDNTILEDKAVADVLGNRFYIPFVFELLDNHMPFYQGDRLEYKLTFNDYHRVIKPTEGECRYSIDNILLE